jgi:hypothetical protein
MIVIYSLKYTHKVKFPCYFWILGFTDNEHRENNFSFKKIIASFSIPITDDYSGYWWQTEMINSLSDSIC